MENNKEKLQQEFYEKLISDKQCIRITKNGVHRLDPSNPMYKAVYDFLKARTEEDSQKQLNIK